VTNASKIASPLPERASELRSELARKLTFFMGSEENRATGIAGLTLHQRIAPTSPCSMTYEPGVTVIAQGRKRVDLGGTTFMYGEGQYLLTSVDLPIVSQIVEASAETPCLALSLKLEMTVIRDLLSREEMPVAQAPSHSPAMATGEATVEFLSACCRLIDLLDTPQDIPFLSGLIQREIIYRILRGPEGTRLRAIATLGDHSHRTAKAIAWIRANYAKPTRGRPRTNRGHGPVHAAPSFPGADRHESSPVSEADSITGCAGTHACRWAGRRQCGLRGWIRKRHPVQSRI
jgi:hypothetical protein